MNNLFISSIGLIVLASIVASDYTLRATCDNRMTVYVDGVQQQGGKTDDKWKKQSVFPVSSSFKVIAIKSIDLHGPEGLLASLHNAAGEDILVTDSSWSCSNVKEKGWTDPNFQETSGNWKPADVIGPHGMAPWRKIGQISDDAKWIWTKTRSAGWSQEPPIFCRYTQKQEYTLRATCDNQLTVYVDGVEQQGTHAYDWTKESVFPVSSSFKVIAMKCRNTGGPYGLVASLHNAAGQDVLVTDSSWSCSNVEEKGWTDPNFQENSRNWKPARVVGLHGMGVWGKIGQISDDAKWIWTETSDAAPVFCRHTSSG